MKLNNEEMVKERERKVRRSEGERKRFGDLTMDICLNSNNETVWDPRFKFSKKEPRDPLSSIILFLSSLFSSL